MNRSGGKLIAFALCLLAYTSAFAQTSATLSVHGGPSPRALGVPQGALRVVAGGGATLSSDLVNPTTGVVSPAQVFDGPFGLVAPDPARGFVYAATGTTLYGATVDSGNGILTPIPGFPYSLPGAITALAVDGSGRFLYVGTAAGIYGATIDPATGALTLIAGSPFAVVGAGASVSDVAGNYLYTATAQNTAQGTVEVLSISTTTGALTPTGDSVVVGVISALAMDPKNRFLFVSGNNGIAGYSIDGTTGGLTAVSTPFFFGDGVAQSAGLSFDGSGKFLYISQSGANLLWGFAVNATTGNLTGVPGSPFLCGTSACYSVAGDASGKYLYAVDENGLLAYQIDSTTGALTYINGLYHGPTNTSVGTSIALVPAIGSPTATLESLQILPANPTVVSGSSQQFTASGTYSDGSQRFLTGSVSWSSSKIGVATISNAQGLNGLATTVGSGSTTISAVLSGVTATTTLTVP